MALKTISHSPLQLPHSALCTVSKLEKRFNIYWGWKIHSLVYLHVMDDLTDHFIFTCQNLWAIFQTNNITIFYDTIIFVCLCLRQEQYLRGSSSSYICGCVLILSQSGACGGNGRRKQPIWVPPPLSGISRIGKSEKQKLSKLSAISYFFLNLFWLNKLIEYGLTGQALLISTAWGCR